MDRLDVIPDKSRTARSFPYLTERRKGSLWSTKIRTRFLRVDVRRQIPVGGNRACALIYPAGTHYVGKMRSALEPVLMKCPVADEAVLLASEMAANSAVHSAAGEFIVRAEVYENDHVWIEVEDSGGPWKEPEPDDRPHGLDIVRLLAGDGNWGIDDNREHGRVVWARLNWPQPDGQIGRRS